MSVWRVHVQDASSGMEVEGKAKLRGFLASASVDGTAKLWDVASKQAVQTFTGHAVRTLVKAALDLRFLPRGRTRSRWGHGC